jgi:nucleoside-diphosphate-sugar epimerase
MKEQTICMLGGTGFVGRHLANRLSDQGCQVRIPTRRRERHRALLVNPRITLTEADVFDADALRAQLTGCDAVINLIGILNESGAWSFTRVHVDLARQVVQACRETGVRRVLHMSALNASASETLSQYLRTKGEAEDLVHAAANQGLQVTSFCPSVIFGPDDSLFNRFAQLLRLTPLVFPLACPDARVTPVYVGDVVDAFTLALGDPATIGKRFELCGPEVYTLRELVVYTAATLNLHRRVLGLGTRLSRLQARLLEFVPGKPFSRDNFFSLQKDGVCMHNGLDSLNITPTSIHAVVPLSLGGRSMRGRYRRYRSDARR